MNTLLRNIPRIVLEIAFIVLGITILVSLMLFQHTELQFREILNVIQQKVSGTGCNSIDLAEQIARIKELGFRLVNANTVTILIAFLNICILGLLLVLYTTIFTKLKKYDGHEKVAKTNQRISDTFSRLNFSIISLKGCMINNAFHLYRDNLDAIYESLSLVDGKKWGLPNELLAHLIIVLEELQLSLDRLLRSYRKQNLEVGKVFEESISQIDSIQDILGNPKQQERFKKDYKERFLNEGTL